MLQKESPPGSVPVSPENGALTLTAVETNKAIMIVNTDNRILARVGWEGWRREC